MNLTIINDAKEIMDSFPYCQEFKDQTIFITGATGLIAKNLAYFFLELNRKQNLNIKVVALVRNLEKAKAYFKDYLKDDALLFMNQDVCDKIEYDGKIDYIFHAAGSASAYAIKSNPVGIVKANTIGTMNVLEFAREKGVKKVVFPSTREIYGKVDNKTLITESDMGTIDPLDPRNCYPESKRLAEALFKAYETQYNVPFSIVRIAHTYGPTMELHNDGRVMADFIAAAVDEKDIVLNSDGTAIRSFCYISDNIIGILYVMLFGKVGEAYNLSNEREPYMIKDVAQKITEINTKKDIKVVFSNPDDEVKKGYLNYKIVRLDNQKIENLGWSPKVTLDDGIKRTLTYFDEEDENIKRFR